MQSNYQTQLTPIIKSFYVKLNLYKSLSSAIISIKNPPHFKSPPQKFTSNTLFAFISKLFDTHSIFRVHSEGK